MSQITFQYKALDDRGGTNRGELKAASRGEAYRRIVASGLRPVNIVDGPVGGSSRRRSRVSLKDLSHLTYQFSVLMEARIPIADGLRSIADQESQTQLREVIEDVARQIESGQTITSAFEPHRAIFGDVYIETLRAAEASGNLSAVLSHLAQMLDQQYEMNKQVKGALMYPICVVAALTLAVMFLVIFVVPKFATMFESRGVALPFLTQCLVWLSDFLRSWWHVTLGGAVAGFIGFRRMLRSQAFRIRLDRLMHRVPHLRSLLVGMAIGRFCHVFGLSLRSGLGLIDALQMAGAASGRPLLRADAERMRNQVNQGGRLADVLTACAYVPGFARRMIIAGEEAGELPKMCQVVAKHYDREVSHLAKNVATVIEPVMIVGLAGVVLVIALAIFLPMWNMAVVIG